MSGLVAIGHLLLPFKKYELFQRLLFLYESTKSSLQSLNLIEMLNAGHSSQMLLITLLAKKGLSLIF